MFDAVRPDSINKSQVQFPTNIWYTVFLLIKRHIVGVALVHGVPAVDEIWVQVPHVLVDKVPLHLEPVPLDRRLVHLPYRQDTAHRRRQELGLVDQHGGVWWLGKISYRLSRDGTSAYPDRRHPSRWPAAPSRPS